MPDADAPAIASVMLSIVILTYNSRDEIDACLASLTSAAPATPHEILVVDNASPDGTANHVRATWPSVRVLDSGGNVGFAAGNNHGIRAAAGDVVLLLNPDTVIPAGAIDALVDVLARDSTAAIVGPRLVDGDGRVELSFGRMIAPFAELRQKLLGVGHDRRLPGIAGYVRRQTRQRQAVDWVSGACLLAQRADLDAVGLFDERYFMYTEDVDLCAAIRARGRTVLFEPAVEVVHLRGRSRRSARSATQQAYRRSHLAFYEKHHPRWAPFLRAYLKLRGQLPDTSSSRDT